MIIYGAGMAGLLAAQMLRRFQPVVFEAQPSLPHNHEALLRFRTDAVSRATGIPFKEVEVTKGVIYKGAFVQHPDLRLNNLYSGKVTGEYMARSISDLRPVNRYIAPSDFVEKMARSVTIHFNKKIEHLDDALDSFSHPIVSTLPMPLMMRMTHWPDQPKFNYHPIWSVTADIDAPATDVYQTLYYPDPAVPYYRASITGNRVIVEFNQKVLPTQFNSYLATVLNDFGIDPSGVSLANVKETEQKYGKLLPIDDAARKVFILALTDKYKVYSLGRFSTWRSGLLMDDVVKDVQRLEGWIADRDTYKRRLEN
jgi:hypothetical protein